MITLTLAKLASPSAHFGPYPLFPIPLPDGYEVTATFTSGRCSTVSIAYPGGEFAAIQCIADKADGETCVAVDVNITTE